METIRDLSHLERKLITIIQNSNRKGISPSLVMLMRRTGRTEEDIRITLKDLIRRKWLAVHNQHLVVLKRLY
ncbi:hypothetical protein ACTWQB_16500 [Piscibacillus sp. B03]|uniref:hypothetical protein n=1 Tax=Piscibacillus sp. B03 TaxID=3457430 RepID=UPI003FCD1877